MNWNTDKTHILDLLDLKNNYIIKFQNLLLQMNKLKRYKNKVLFKLIHVILSEKFSNFSEYDKLKLNGLHRDY